MAFIEEHGKFFDYYRVKCDVCSKEQDLNNFLVSSTAVSVSYALPEGWEHRIVDQTLGGHKYAVQQALCPGCSAKAKGAQ